MTEPELKPLDWHDIEIDIPCFKCGSHASPDVFVTGMDTSKDLFVIRCDNDQECGLITHLYKTIDDAIEAWNKRS